MNENIGKKIKELRATQSIKTGTKITQQVLADKVGTSRSYIGDIESGRTSPGKNILSMIAIALGVDSDYFESEFVYDKIVASDLCVKDNSKDYIVKNDVTLSSNFIADLIASGAIVDADNISEDTKNLIMNVIQQEIKTRLNKKGK